MFHSYQTSGNIAQNSLSLFHFLIHTYPPDTLHLRLTDEKQRTERKTEGCPSFPFLPPFSVYVVSKHREIKWVREKRIRLPGHWCSSERHYLLSAFKQVLASWGRQWPCLLHGRCHTLGLCWFESHPHTPHPGSSGILCSWWHRKRPRRPGRKTDTRRTHTVCLSSDHLPAMPYDFPYKTQAPRWHS